MSVCIEKASIYDAEKILEYMKKIGAETDNLTFGAEGLPFTVKEEAEYIKGLENSSDEVIFVAKVNGEIVGDASLSRLPRRMSHRGDLGIAVLCEHWNEGIGSRLLSEIINFAKENSFDVIELQVRSDNANAIHLYEKFGFEMFCKHERFFKIGNEYVSFDYMSLNLI